VGYGSVFQKYGERWLKKTEKKFPALIIEPMKQRVIRGNPNIYGNKYVQPEFLWNRWPDVFRIRMGVKLAYA
jgi:hypothetical protein